ncbi:MAG TPA: FIST C-terminal domain-containing protein [Burkholderiales bacterium]|nr:FIST C-terminal domain-containing protein [Burkholderiales bacterium]
MTRHGFTYGHAAGREWQETARACLGQIGRVPRAANLGFLYVTDLLVPQISEILTFFKVQTSIPHWVGTVGVGVCGTGKEYLNQPAMAVMLAELPEGSFNVFRDVTHGAEELPMPAGDAAVHFAIVHADPHTPEIGTLIEDVADAMQSGFLVGGLTSSRNRHAQIADEVVQGGLSGVIFSDAVAVSTRLTQGCSPIGPRHLVSECRRNIIISLDGRPALEVFKEDIGEVLAHDLNRTSGYIFAGLPVPGSDTGDYLVRNLIGIDIDHQLIAIGEMLEHGMPLMFCRRDGATAHEDMLRMLNDIKRDLKAQPRGAVYFSCLGRGEHMFGANSRELELIQGTLGDIPLVGFFANGEISHNRLYGYTGVLTLFV